MALSIPLVWSDDHRLHEPDAEIWVGVRTPAAEVPARAEAIRAALVGAGAEVVAATRHDDAALEAVHDAGAARVPRLRLAGVGGRRAARRPGPGPRRPVHLPAPGPAGRARAARAGRDVGAAGSVLLRHDDADRARHLGGRAGRRRRRPHRRRPRLPAGRSAAYACCRPPGPPRDAQRLRRLLLPEQRRDRGRSGCASTAPRGSAIVDIDAHHGNGAQQIFWERDDVFTGSVHVDPAAGWFPHFLGTAAERGGGAGRGANLNVPLPPGAGDADWLARRGRGRAGGPRRRCRGARARARRRRGGRRPREPARRHGERLPRGGAHRRRPGASGRRRAGGRVRSRLDRRARARDAGGTRGGVVRPMPEPLAVWLGKDEVEGVPSQPRKDLKPPPHWRLEAVAATERPRSLTLGADGAHGGLHPGPRHLRRVAARARRRRDAAVPQRLTTGRDPMPFWEDTEPRLSPDGTTVAYADQGHVWVVAAAGGPPRKLVEAGSPVWLGNDRLVVSVERDDTSRLAVLDVADPWPRPLCGSEPQGRTRPQARSSATATSGGRPSRPTARTVAFVFTPRHDLLRSEIRVADVATGATRALTGAERLADKAPAWSPDGSLIAFTSERSGWYELHLVSPDGSGERQLTLGAARTSASTTGIRTAAVSSRSAAAATASTSSPSTRRAASVTVVAEGGAWGAPHWTADGAILATYEDAATPAEIRLVREGEAAGHAPRPGAARRPRRPARAPRGRHVHVVRRGRDPGLPLPAGRSVGGDPGARGRLPARRPHELLRRRVGRPRPVLRRQGVRVARDQLPRLDRATGATSSA